MARKKALALVLLPMGLLFPFAITGAETTGEAPDGAPVQISAQADFAQADTAPADEELFAEGREVFRRCQACHVIDSERHLVGPHLIGLFGRVSGTVEAFRYSDAMVDAAIVWDDETLTAYLQSPRDYIPGNRMAFPGLTDEDLITALLYFLRETTTPAE